MKTISHEPGDETAWNCLCGNRPMDDGFSPSDAAGHILEPVEEGTWTSLYVCNRCRRIIDQNDLKIVGRGPS